jgi:hypothetical protein
MRRDWDQFKAILLCILVISSSATEAASEQDHTYYFNA